MLCNRSGVVNPDLSCYRFDVNARLAFFLFCLLLVACKHPSPPAYFPPDAPDLATKLGISGSDWQALQQLSSEEKGMVMFGVAKPLPNAIEIEFGKPSDHLQDQGGPLYRYEFENGIWKKDETFVGVWNVHRSR